MFFISHARISLIGEINLISDTVDNQRNHGANVAVFRSFDLKPNRYVSRSTKTRVVIT